MPRKTLVSALIAVVLAGSAWAAPQEEKMLYYRDGVRVDPVEVSKILARPGLKRSIRLLPPADEPLGGAQGQNLAALSSVAAASVELSPAPAPAPAPARDEPESVALPVQFGFDSAEILPKARSQLDAMAEGIKLLPESHKVVIEGHTDATGSHEYNLQLSHKRAEAVKRYLVGEHGLDPQRLRTVGFGKERPIGGLDASSPVNRRVQFRGA